MTEPSDRPGGQSHERKLLPLGKVYHVLFWSLTGYSSGQDVGNEKTSEHSESVINGGY